MVLDKFQIDKGSSDFIDEAAERTLREAMWNVGDAHIWSSNGEKVADLNVSAALSDVSCNECSLRKSYNVDLSSTCELFVGEEISASFLGLLLSGLSFHHQSPLWIHDRRR